MRGTQLRGAFPGLTGNRVLPNPSPAANLVGIWKGNGHRFKTAALPAVFYCSSVVLEGGEMLNRESPVKGIIKSLGLVFGDIGTSPIYTLTVIFLLTNTYKTNRISFDRCTFSHNMDINHTCYYSVCLACYEPWTKG